MATPTASTASDLVPAGRWELDPAHTTLEFRVRHAGLARVRGVFEGFEGVIDVTADGRLRGDASIDASTLTTGVNARDEHLRSSDFFDVEQHPHLTFSSTAVDVDADGQVTAHGLLTIRGVTREIVLEGEVLGSSLDDEGDERIGLELTGRLDRRDFGLTWNTMIDGGGMLVGNRVDIAIDVSAVRVKGRTA